MNSYIPNCEKFFEDYDITINNTLYVQLSNELKSILDIIYDYISTHYNFEETGPFDKNESLITVLRNPETLEIVFTDINQRYYVINNEGKWEIYDDEEFSMFFADEDENSDDCEDVWTP